MIMLLVRDFFASIIPPVIVLALQFLRMAVLPTASTLDIVAHFCGGLAIAWSASILWYRWEKRGWFFAHPLVRDYAIVMTALFVGVAWEWWEFWMQIWTGNVFQPSIADTMQDLFMDTIGGLLVVLVIKLISLRSISQSDKNQSPSV